MAGSRRALLTGGVVVLLVTAAVVTVATVQRADPGHRPVAAASTTPTDRQVDASGGDTATSRSLAPSNALGAPVPDPSSVRVSGEGGPAVEPWWRRVPPAAGTLTAPDGSGIGQVTVLASDDDTPTASDTPTVSDTLTVTIVGDPSLPAAATRAVLTGAGGAEEDLGPISPDMRGVGFVLGATDADHLPDPVRALELRDPAGRVVAAAVLLPV